MNDTLVRILATGMGAGYSPLAPGTAGTLVAIPLFILLASAGAWWVVAGAVVTAVIGVPAAGRMEVILGRKDPGPVVIDEIAGYLVTMIGSPPTWPYILLGFFLFRIFDIVKPPPVRYLERALPGGLGVMADDLMAGCYALAALQVIGRALM